MGIHAVTGSLYLVIMCLFSVITGSPLQDSSCGGVLKGKNGQFQSPRYPAPYPEAVTCKWTITGPENAEKIVITFSKFDIEWGPDCRFDFVRILDGGNEIAGHYKNCGSKDDLKVEVPGRIAYVVLVSDSTGTAQGFKAMFEAVSPKVVSKGDCDFDQGLCDDWSHDVNGNFQWTLGSGSTPSALTGPSSDHSGTGSYLFIESSPPRKEGDKARIVSTSLQAARCLTFYYFMYGVLGMGSLNVYIRSAGKDTPIWGLSGDQGRKWKKAQIPLPVDGSSSFQIVIEGTVGKSDYSDIAVDDITFSKEVCQPGGCGKRLNGMSGTFSTPDFPDKYPDDSRCTWTISGPPGTKKIIVKFLKFDLQLDGRCSKDYVRVFNKDGKQLGPNYCSFYPFGFGVKVDGNMAKIYFHSDNFIRRRGFSATFETIQVESADDCDFDDGTTCSWTNSKLDDFDWTTRGGRTPSYFTGPSTDYLGLGKYAFIESSYRKQGDKARLVSKSMSGARCMLFMYNLRGIHMGKINVFQSYQDNRQPKSLFTISGNHERDWHKAMVDIPHDKDLYKIIIEGVVGSGFTSDAAIDEITFTSGSCPSQTCGGYLTANMGAISTPYYPRNYPNQAYCEWVINPFPYYKNLDITFEDFDVEKSPGCSKDYVRVLDAHKTQIGEKQCGLLKDMQQTTFKLQQQTATRSHALYGYKAYVVFSSDSNGTRRGFKASYKVSQSRQICGGQLSGSSGNFSSPNYPNNYPTDEICEWEITASDVNKRLQISFKDFFIDDTVTCYYNYLMVYGGNKFERYCGNLSLRPIRIPSHVANIRFVTSQYYGPARGFLAEWRSVL